MPYLLINNSKSNQINIFKYNLPAFWKQFLIKKKKKKKNPNTITAIKVIVKLVIVNS